MLLTVLGAGAGLAYALISSAQYTAKAYVAVVAQDPGDSSAVSYAQAFSRIASQGDALKTAADASQGSASMEELRRSVLAAASPDAPVIELTGTAGTPERAADLVNLLGNGLIKTANSHTADTRMRLALLSAAVPPADPTSPQLPLAVAVGAAAGLLLGGLAFLGRGERYQPDRHRRARGGKPDSAGAGRRGELHDGNNTIERLANWTMRAPAKVMTRFSADSVKPPGRQRQGDNGGAVGGAGRRRARSSQLRGRRGGARTARQDEGDGERLIDDHE